MNAVEHNFPLDGEYVIQPRLFRTNLGAMRGLEYPHQLEITVDGARVHLSTFGGDRGFQGLAPEPDACRRRRRCPGAGAGEAQCRPAHHRRRVHREAGVAEQLAAAAVRAQLARHIRPHRLAGIYARAPDAAAARAQKAAEFARLAEALSAGGQPAAGDFNNARLVAVAIYERCVPALRAELDRLDNDLPAYYSAMNLLVHDPANRAKICPPP